MANNTTHKLENLVKVQTSNIEMNTVMPPNEERLMQNYYPDIIEDIEKVTIIEKRDGTVDHLMVMIKNTEYEPPNAEPLPDPECRKMNSVELFWCKMNDEINEPLCIDRVMSDTMMRRSIDNQKVIHPTSDSYQKYQQTSTSTTTKPTNFPQHYYKRGKSFRNSGQNSKSSRKSKRLRKSNRK